jgi:broad specificity phosphatase PhoE
MTLLYLVRHGETDWNVEGRWQGQTDVPLNQNGLAQATQVAELLLDVQIEAIYASDLRRTLDTARAIGEREGLPVIPDERLRERNHGVWEGLTLEEIQVHYGQEYQEVRKDLLNNSPPGGENGLQVQRRVVSAVLDIVNRHPENAVAVVSHGFSLAVLRAYFSDHPFGRVRELIPKNGEIIRLEARNGFHLDQD